MCAAKLFQEWRHRADRAERAVIFPDGCRDVLISRSPGAAARVTLTPFDFRPRLVALPRGTRMSGYRLRPGAVVGQRVLYRIAADSDGIAEILGNELGECDETDEAILALATTEATPAGVAKGLGVSARSLQRHFRRMGLPPPDYWRLLGRARRAAGILATGAPLAEIALDCGLSDQAHMTRELRRWFGTAPAQLRRDAPLLGLLRQPALGNWTDEQISTR